MLLGLDNAGKTVAAKNLAGEAFEEVVPTVGFSVINLSYMNFKVEVFDLGGGSNIRGIWSRYFVDVSNRIELKLIKILYTIILGTWDHICC